MTTKTITNHQPKLNSRQKLVLINALKGMNQTEAYQTVYGQNPNSYTLASELFRKPHFKAELDRLQNKTVAAIEKTIMQPAEIKQRLSTLARASLVDFLDESGEPVLSKTTPNSEAVTEYYRRTRVDRDGHPIITKNIKLVNPIDPLRELAKIHGMYAPSKHLVGHVRLVNQFVDRKNRELEGEKE